MENFLVDFITLYGPMSFGWVAAGYLAVQNKTQQARYQEILVHIVEANTKAMTELTIWLKTTRE